MKNTLTFWSLTKSIFSVYFFHIIVHFQSIIHKKKKNKKVEWLSAIKSFKIESYVKIPEQRLSLKTNVKRIVWNGKIYWSKFELVQKIKHRKLSYLTTKTKFKHNNNHHHKSLAIDLCADYRQIGQPIRKLSDN